MTDVLKIALDRRSELEDEIGKLDAFIRMAEELVQMSNQKHAGDVEDAMPPTARQRPATVQTPEPVVRTQSRRGPVEEESAGPSRPQVIRRAVAASKS